MDFSKYITDALRPDHLNFNRAYTDNNKNAMKLYNEQPEQTMDDESDSPLRQQAARVFCCGETSRTSTKLLLNRSGPGQAVQVITVQSRDTGNVDAMEVSREKLVLKRYYN